MGSDDTKYGHVDKWSTHKQEGFQKNQMQGWNFEIQIDHKILARRLDLMLRNKKRSCHLEDFAI